MLEQQEEANLSRSHARQQAVEDQELVTRIVVDIFARVQQQLLQEDRSELRRLAVQIQADIEALDAQQAAAFKGECHHVHGLLAAACCLSIAAYKQLMLQPNWLTASMT